MNCSNGSPCRSPASLHLEWLSPHDLRYPREEPSAGKPHARICEGEAEWLSYSTTNGKNASCHVFRHSAATAMLDNGADIRFIQEMLGHAKLTSTQVYTRVSITKLKAVHAATHPAATLEGKRGTEALEGNAVPPDDVDG